MAISFATFARSPGRLVAVVCAGQVLVQIGAFFWPALLPGMIPLWRVNAGVKFRRRAGAIFPQS
jgi:hypothetical protein